MSEPRATVDVKPPGTTQTWAGWGKRRDGGRFSPRFTASPTHALNSRLHPRPVEPRSATAPFVARVVISGRRKPSAPPSTIAPETGAEDEVPSARARPSGGGGGGVRDQLGVRTMPAEWTVRVELPRVPWWTSFEAGVIRVLGVVVAASLLVLLVSIAAALA